MTFPINIPKNHYELGDYDGHVLEKNLNAIYDIIVYWKKNLFMFPTGRVGKDYIRWNHTVVKCMDTRFCYETYYAQSDNGDAVHNITEAQSQIKSEGSFWNTPAKNDSMVIPWLITTV